MTVKMQRASAAWMGTVLASLVCWGTARAEAPAASPPLAPEAHRIDTAFLQGPWPRQAVRTLEVGRHEVQWRQRASRQDGIFAGVHFIAPLDRQRIWELTTDYGDVGRMTPGVKAVRYLERTPNRQVIQLDVQVLWKTVQLTFEVEQDPPTAMRFRLVDERLGEYRGVCWLEELTGGSSGQGDQERTIVELATWLQPSRPVPMRLLLLVERMAFLRATETFLDRCDAQHPVGQRVVSDQGPS